MTETKVKKSTKWKYHTYITFKDGKDNSEHTFQTQLYRTGIYGIWDNNSGQQGNYTAGQMVSINKKLKQLEIKGTIKDVEWGREITVTTDESGLYKEV
jgi:hypothetical protein